MQQRPRNRRHPARLRTAAHAVRAYRRYLGNHIFAGRSNACFGITRRDDSPMERRKWRFAADFEVLRQNCPAVASRYWEVSRFSRRTLLFRQPVRPALAVFRLAFRPSAPGRPAKVDEPVTLVKVYGDNARQTSSTSRSPNGIWPWLSRSANGTYTSPCNRRVAPLRRLDRLGQPGVGAGTI